MSCAHWLYIATFQIVTLINYSNRNFV